MKNILVIDDSISDAALTIRALRQSSQSCVIATALDGDDALTLLLNKKFDVAIVDLNMPRVDGIELLKRIGQECAHAVKSIVISGSRSIARQITAVEAGAIDFVYKEIDFDEFALRLNNAVAKLDIQSA